MHVRSKHQFTHTYTFCHVIMDSLVLPVHFFFTSGPRFQRAQIYRSFACANMRQHFMHVVYGRRRITFFRVKGGADKFQNSDISLVINNYGSRQVISKFSGGTYKLKIWINII
uniref:Uncharacterized protein n=1 Tax=Cacopsylla melanoneura TaxID=428564 RepID=A0A8D8QEI4_9HEMI